MSEHPVAAVCGQSDTAVSLGITPERIGGCGKPITTCAEVYRCVECAVPFHRDCAKQHFAMSGNRWLLDKEETQLEVKELKLDARDHEATIALLLDALRSALNGWSGQLYSGGRLREDTVTRENFLAIQEWRKLLDRLDASAEPAR